MEQEVSFAVDLGVALIALSAVVAIIWFTVFMGKTFAGDVIDEGGRIIEVVEVGELSELTEETIIIPGAAVYNLLRTYNDYIGEYHCEHGTYSSIDYLKHHATNHMKGKDKVQIEYTDKNWYSVTILSD